MQASKRVSERVRRAYSSSGQTYSEAAYARTDPRTDEQKDANDRQTDGQTVYWETEYLFW